MAKKDKKVELVNQTNTTTQTEAEGLTDQQVNNSEAEQVKPNEIPANQFAYVQTQLKDRVFAFRKVIFKDDKDCTRQVIEALCRIFAAVAVIRDVAKMYIEAMYAKDSEDAKRERQNADAKIDGLLASMADVPVETLREMAEAFPAGQVIRMQGNGGNKNGHRRVDWEMTKKSQHTNPDGTVEITLHLNRKTVTAKMYEIPIKWVEFNDTHTSHLDNNKNVHPEGKRPNQEMFIMHVLNDIAECNPPLRDSNVNNDFAGIANGIRDSFGYHAKNAGSRSGK